MILAIYFKNPDLLQLATAGIESGGQQTSQQPTSRRQSPSATTNDQAKQFVATVLADTEKTWGQLLRDKGIRYPEPTVVMFSNAVRSQCGVQPSEVGPFYCPLDHKVYLDPTFFQELAQRHDAPGDFAAAYVLAHEVGHHVQNVLGVSEKVHAQRRRVSKTEGNRLSVMQELQADCYAGVWAHHANTKRNLLEAGDVEEGLRAANQIGDDVLQKQGQGYVVPERFTHGTAAQRKRWLMIGLKSGDVDSCNTFAARNL